MVKSIKYYKSSIQLDDAEKHMHPTKIGVTHRKLPRHRAHVFAVEFVTAFGL